MRDFERKPPTLVFAPLAWLKLQYFCHAGPTEIGGFAITAAHDPLYVEDFQTVRQQASPLSIHFDDAAVAERAGLKVVMVEGSEDNRKITTAEDLARGVAMESRTAFGFDAHGFGPGNAVMLGAFQAHSKAWDVPRVPENFSFQLLEPDWEKFAEPLRNGKHRIPTLETCGFAKFVNGPESFTHDNRYLLGETPEVAGFFVACGFNSVGIQSAAGAGKALAEWIVGGAPPFDLWDVDVRRTFPWQATRGCSDSPDWG